MSLSPKEQFRNFLKNAAEILVLVPENPDNDALSSAFALCLFLEKAGHAATLVSAGRIPERLSFLKKPASIVSSISGARDFVLSFDISRNRISNVRQEQDGDTLNIYLTPEKGSLDPKDFSFILAKFRYDLAITIGCSDLEKLGPVRSENPDLFFEVPVVNIDFQSSNENFGQVNLVDVTACSNSEIAKDLVSGLDPEAIDTDIATCLLTGIISATDSFQKKSTTPRSLLAAAELMEKGADQQEIVRWLYKTQPLHLLKLMGRMMSRIRWEESEKIVWAPLSIEDFVQSRSVPDSLPEILDRLRENYGDGRIFMATYSKDSSGTAAVIRPAESGMLSLLQSVLGGKANNGCLMLATDGPDPERAGENLIERLREHS